jgi:hypothetical protein
MHSEENCRRYSNRDLAMLLKSWRKWVCFAILVGVVRGPFGLCTTIGGTIEFRKTFFIFKLLSLLNF